ncbi:MAG: hypothetical protein GYB53_21630 [Rhodobacteraceae bacterium]|nr:hypothetical protein [Paracoccaceae bacterium]MBR9819679.1 hypothetical protein [Paracoccaceae bacterium]
MTLTVPMAGSEAGRAARLRVDARQDGQALGAFGEKVQGIFQQVERFELDSEFERAQVDATRDLNNLRLEVEEIADPRVAGQTWDQRSAAIRERYLQGDGTSAGLNQRNHERFGLAFDQSVNAHGFNLGKRFLADRIAQREATSIQAMQEYTRAATMGGGESAAEWYERGIADIRNREAEGIIDPDQAELQIIQLGEDIYGAIATEDLNTDPAAFLRKTEEQGAYPGLSAQRIATMRGQAMSAIEQGVKFGATQEKKETGDFLQVIRAEAKSGKDVHWQDLLSDPRITGHDDFAKTEAIVLTMQERPELAMMSVTQLDAEIAKERSTAPGNERSARRLEAMLEIRDSNLDGYEKDPIAQAALVKLPVPEFAVELDPADPTAFAQGVRARLAFAEQMKAEGYVSGALRPFSDKEEDQLKLLADTDQEPATRAALARIAASAVAEDGSTPVLDLLDDPVLSHVGGLLAAGGRESLGQEILQGQAAIDLGNALTPPASERLEEAQAVVGDVLVGLPGEEVTQQEINQSIEALFALRMKPTDPSGEMNSKVYRQAAHEVMGGTGKYDGRDARGGIQDFRGAETIIPMGLNADQLDNTLRMLGTDGDGSSYLGASRSFTPERFEAHLRDISGGAVPVVDGKPISRDDLLDGRVSFKAIGDDVYILQVETSTGLKTIQADTGGDYQLSLRRLSRVFAP